MCDFQSFRSKAHTMFSTLIVSVGIFEKGTGRGIGVTMYRLKVAGMSIGDDIASQAADPEVVLAEVLRRVIIARKAVRDARTASDLARRAAAGMRVQLTPVAVPAMVAQAGDNKPAQHPQLLALAQAA